jgi:uncharacterized membrane protein
MTKLFLRSGRLTWPPVLVVLFSTLTVMATDYAWRMVQGSTTVIALCGVLLLVAGNAAIFILAKRSR